MTIDISRFQAKLARLQAFVPAYVPERVGDVAFDVLIRSGYADPDEAQTSGGDLARDLNALITPPTVEENRASVGIVQIYDWALGEAYEHCHWCIETEAHGPYTSDFPYRPETAPSHSPRNPCHCLWVPRQPDISEDAAASFQDFGAALAAAMEATWSAS